MKEIKSLSDGTLKITVQENLNSIDPQQLFIEVNPRSEAHRIRILKWVEKFPDEQDPAWQMVSVKTEHGVMRVPRIAIHFGSENGVPIKLP